MTQNHSFNTPEKGEKNWHIPLNENFRRLDTGLEIRDEESNLDQYEPKKDAKFIAVDTETAFIGDGDQWNEVNSSGKQPSFESVEAGTINDTVIASPGDVQSTIESVADSTGKRARVALKPQSVYSPTSTWNVKQGVDLDFNSAKITLTNNIDVIHIEPGGRVINPQIDYSGVTYSSTVFTMDATQYGRYDEEIDSTNGFGSGAVVGGRTVGTSGEGTAFYFYADNSTGIGGDNLYNARIYEHNVHNTGTAIDIHSENAAYVNSIHMDNLYLSKAQTFLHIRGTGVAADLRIENTNVQPGTITDYVILQDNGDHIYFDGTIWDKMRVSEQVWQLNSGAGGASTVVDNWKFEPEDITDNSGSMNNKWYSVDRGVRKGTHGVKFYNSNNVPKSVIKQSEPGGTLTVKPTGDGGNLNLHPNGMASWDWGGIFRASHGLQISVEDLTSKGDPSPVGDEADTLYMHDGSGSAPAGLYRTDPGNGQYVKVEDNSTTISY